MIRILQALSLVAPIVAEYTFPTGFDLNAVDSNTRAGWCRGERNACPLICDGVAIVNNCDTTTLNFTCTCSGGKAAPVEDYMETIPFYVCHENYGQCISHSTTQDGDEVCKKGLDDCGTKNASEIASSSSSTTTSATAVPTEAGGSSDSSDSSDDSAQSTPTTTTETSPTSTPGAAARVMQNYGMTVMATVMFIGFGLVL